MAYAVLDKLQQTLKQILKRDDDLTTVSVKQRIISIHDNTVVLQFYIKEFPEKGTIRDVANTTQEVVEYLFSPENLSDCGSIDPAVKLSNQLRELSEELGSTVGAVLDYCKSKGSVNNVSDSPSSSKSDVDLTVSVEPTVGVSNRLGKLAEKLTSTANLVDYSGSNDSVDNIRQLRDSPAVSSSSRPVSTSKDVVDYCKSKGSVKNVSDSPSSSKSDVDLTVSGESTVGVSNRLGKSAEKLTSTAGKSSRLAPTGKTDAVGLDRDVVAIKERLLNETHKLQILPIVGTGGIGKTTLARNVYHDPLIIGHFYIRAWVTVSQDYSFGDIFLNLLASMKDIPSEESQESQEMAQKECEEITGLSSMKDIRSEESQKDIRSEESQKMAKKVFQTLTVKRYLIVIDDMWSKKTWEEIRFYFPDTSVGSRIILTTRLEDVAAHAGSGSGSSNLFHKMRFMDVDQSWDLLQKEVFKGKSPLPTMEEIGRKIAASCGGLPLAISVVAGLLSEVGQSEAEWEQIADNINLAIAAEDEMFAAILSLSYSQLPHHLRPCFLYMGAFPKDYEIRVSKLIKLWIAEGFVGSTETRTPEEAAEEFLEDLVKRNLVLVTKRKFNGRVKSCGLHDLLRDLCLIRSLEENFLLSFMGSLFLPEIFETQRRISISHSNILAHIDGSTISTIICCGYSSSDSFEKFSLLRILDVLNTNVPAQVYELPDLRFLAFCYTTLIPASISNLQNLQTLIIYPKNASMVTLPVEIWNMPQLRHLVASSFDPLPDLETPTRPLQNLQTLSLATNFVCSGTMVRMIPNIKKLGICYALGKFDRDYHLENLRHFDHLEKLKLEMEMEMQMLHGFSFREKLNPVFPQSLRKLTLSGCRLPWEDLSVVGSLPNLQVLKLKNYAYDGGIWETNDGEFKNLEFLLIDKSNLEEWSTDSGHFPKLKCLVLYGCMSLMMIPDEIGDVMTLELIELESDGRNQSLVESAKNIQYVQETEYGNYGIRLRY